MSIVDFLFVGPQSQWVSPGRFVAPDSFRPGLYRQ